MTVRPAVCQRQNFGHEDFFHCSHCVLTWNTRDTGEHWRPNDCPERLHRKEDRMIAQSMRDEKNHDGK